MTYIRGVDYKGLNGSVTSTIYHTTQNIGCTIGKQHISTTLTQCRPLTPCTLELALCELMHKHNDNTSYTKHIINVNHEHNNKNMNNMKNNVIEIVAKI